MQVTPAYPVVLQNASDCPIFFAPVRAAPR
jgi:hypothetical protein